MKKKSILAATARHFRKIYMGGGGYYALSL